VDLALRLLHLQLHLLSFEDFSFSALLLQHLLQLSLLLLPELHLGRINVLLRNWILEEVEILLGGRLVVHAHAVGLRSGNLSASHAWVLKGYLLLLGRKDWLVHCEIRLRFE